MPGVSRGNHDGGREGNVRELYGLAADEAAFLVDAAEHFCATRCPLAVGDGACVLLGWRESVHSGALQMTCKADAATWRERLGGGRRIRAAALAT
jgi:hypothetical protein